MCTVIAANLAPLRAFVSHLSRTLLYQKANNTSPTTVLLTYQNRIVDLITPFLFLCSGLAIQKSQPVCTLFALLGTALSIFLDNYSIEFCVLIT